MHFLVHSKDCPSHDNVFTPQKHLHSVSASPSGPCFVTVLHYHDIKYSNFLTNANEENVKLIVGTDVTHTLIEFK